MIGIIDPDAQPVTTEKPLPESGKLSIKAVTGLNVVYSDQPMPTGFNKAIFLAGPTPRDQQVPSWRPEALRILAKLGYDGVVFVPERSDGHKQPSYDDQIVWEEQALSRADAIVFWIPRDLQHMPAFTTNTEYGMWYRSGKCILGYPPETPKMQYLRFFAEQHGVPCASTLDDTLAIAVNGLREGAFRLRGETEVPLHVWKTYQFQEWYKNQQEIGNELRGARVEWTHCIGAEGRLFFFILHVKVWVKAEDRVKENEVIISRPDIASLVLFHRKPGGNELDNTHVVLVREFRSPVTNPTGFVYDLPGGSSFKDPSAAVDVAVSECTEETGFKISPDRITSHTTRQIGATLSTHKAHLFSARLTDEELEYFLGVAGQTFGVSDETEMTYVTVLTLREILANNNVDWSTLGLIYAALADNA